MDDLERQYRALVERISSYPMPGPARAAIPAEIEALAEEEGNLPQLDLDPVRL